MEQDILKGMTVNERLFALGLFDEFDRTVQQDDKEQKMSVSDFVRKTVDSKSLGRLR